MERGIRKTSLGCRGMHGQKPLQDAFFKYLSNYQCISDKTDDPMVQHIKIIH